MVKYIVAGFQKTGTKSLAQAFRSLGYRVYDAGEMHEHFRDHWTAFFDGKFGRIRDLGFIRAGYYLANFLRFFC